MTAPTKRQPIPFGKYLLLDRINIGGMAEVWRGKSFGAGGFERLVAIKRILPSIAEDEEFISMFIDEAKITVQLTHANVAQVYELGNVANSYFIAMEYIPGKDMRAIFDRCRKRGEPAPVPLTCYVVAKLCEGLDYAHRKKDGMGRDMNIVHRDISPQNVLISYEGEVKVIDFGIAKAAGKATKTQAGILKGKFAYMSPEQIRGLPLDRRSDIFAIGICLYELLTGERLFVGDSDFSVLEKVRKAEVLPPSTYNKRVPEALERIVLKALAREVEDRYQYASEVADDLQRFLITSDSIFSRKDLMQYMKSTFAEEVEREKLRLQEYADVKPGEGLLTTADQGFGGSAPDPVRLSPSLTSIPRLTAAAPLLTGHGDDEGGATMLVDGSQFFNDDLNGPTLVRSDTGSSPVPPPPDAIDPMLAQPTQYLVDRKPELDPMLAQPTQYLPGVPARSSSPSVAAPSRPAMKVPAPRPLEQLPRIEEEDEPVESTSTDLGRRTFAAEAIAPPPRFNPKLLGIVAAALVLVLAGAGFVLFRGEPQGFLFLQLPDELKGRAKVSINGAEVTDWPPFQKVTAGPAAVVITAEGWKPYAGTVAVTEGTEVTKFAPRLEQTITLGQLAVSVEPDRAEIVLDGKVVKTAQEPGGLFIGKVPVAPPSTLEVRLAGYKTHTQKVAAKNAQETVRVSVKLEPFQFPVQVTSEPPGASIVVGGKVLGVTPAVVQVPSGTTELSLTKSCFDEAVVPVKLAGAPGEASPVSGTLTKQPGCR